MICKLAGAQTCSWVKFLTLSFKPMLNSNKVMPIEAILDSNSVLSKPAKFRINPAAKKPMSGGSFICNMMKPQINAVAKKMISIDLK